MESLKLDSGPDHLALGPVLKGKTHLPVPKSSADFLLLSPLPSPIGQRFGLLDTK